MIEFLGQFLFTFMNFFDNHIIIYWYEFFYNFCTDNFLEETSAEMIASFGTIVAIFFMLGIMLFFIYQILKICFKGVLNICGLV